MEKNINLIEEKAQVHKLEHIGSESENVKESDDESKTSFGESSLDILNKK